MSGDTTEEGKKEEKEEKKAVVSVIHQVMYRQQLNSLEAAN